MIKIGTSLTLELKNTENDESEKFRCKMVEQAKNFIFIDYPINVKTGKTNIFFKGTEFEASFVGSDQSVYCFSTEIKGKQNIKIPTLILSYPGDDQLLRIQRRQYVRIESAIDVSVHEMEGVVQPFTTVTQDISGGGASILLPTHSALRPSMELDLWLVLPMQSGQYEYIYATSEVIRVIEGNQDYPSTASIHFTAIQDKDRQSIIRYCFEKQLIQRRRF
ncbi:flagellar brake domain-containing protein [Aquibacillus sp. 3ASR75-11]|uniref:Flagellar brake domain-containing protein n=1 Tax=Terrihalobacillus insolitus TaxID=2950438 RepID=A0A9X3WRP6_9BACI|nr:flagellar brake domain-containing protein [Terrihalobacillus insolitus]MDC3424812.1 flagellar brake domain-containing protein [Terrihalobacillus insolitus]